MKLVKSEVEEVTKDALTTAMLALACLRISGCPEPKYYEFVEEFAAKLEKHRIALGLESLVPDAFLEKKFSQSIAKMVSESEALELTPEQAEQVKALLGTFGKGVGKPKKSGKSGIGFKLEDLEFDPKKVN